LLMKLTLAVLHNKFSFQTSFLLANHQSVTSYGNTQPVNRLLTDNHQKRHKKLFNKKKLRSAKTKDEWVNKLFLDCIH
jgi:hypothetical protein